MGDTDTLKDTWIEGGTPALEATTGLSVNTDVIDRMKLREQAFWSVMIGDEVFAEHGTLFDDEQFMAMNYRQARGVAEHIVPQLVIDGEEKPGPDLSERIFDLIDPRVTDFPDLTA